MVSLMGLIFVLIVAFDDDSENIKWSILIILTVSIYTIRGFCQTVQTTASVNYISVYVNTM